MRSVQIPNGIGMWLEPYNIWERQLAKVPILEDYFILH